MFTFKLHLLRNGQGENFIYLLQESYFLTLSLCEIIIFHVTKTEIWFILVVVWVAALRFAISSETKIKVEK